jgi:hypothetical protein
MPSLPAARPLVARILPGMPLEPTWVLFAVL